MGLAPSQGNGWVRFQPALTRKVGQISTGVDNGAQHPQILTTAPKHLPVAACRAVVNSLIKSRLLIEVAAPRDQLAMVWRKDGDGTPILIQVTDVCRASSAADCVNERRAGFLGGMVLARGEANIEGQLFGWCPRGGSEDLCLIFSLLGFTRSQRPSVTQFASLVPQALTPDSLVMEFLGGLDLDESRAWQQIARFEQAID